MNDNEIIKALECCKDEEGLHFCSICPMYKNDPDNDFCQENLCENALDLINRQRAEIEDLKDINEHLNVFVLEAREAAIKEVFEKLKAIKVKPEFPWDDFYVTESMLEEVEKEMTEGTE